ncbi:hypothetical protein Csa_005335 [Cucumis sativus]|uniref:Uncharacterized protein n=1 Tax=Cucumis sativus TaxID=3659 RepID=A0A0A0KE10_CUCSA|nr:hypothetical protein Csa_005335 [Cucumis sativus]
MECDETLVKILGPGERRLPSPDNEFGMCDDLNDGTYCACCDGGLIMVRCDENLMLVVK